MTKLYKHTDRHTDALTDRAYPLILSHVMTGITVLMSSVFVGTAVNIMDQYVSYTRTSRIFTLSLPKCLLLHFH